MAEVQGIDTVQLLENIDESYSADELKVLSFQLKIDYDEVSGGNKKIVIVNLIDYCKRRGRLLELVKQCEKERPHIQWFQKLQSQTTSFETVEERIAHRKGLYEEAADLQLVHTILPSTRQENYWDVLIYLIRHQSDDLSMVDHAEFFLGKYWGNKIFHAANSEGFIGIAISAYGPTLSTCRVLLTDGRAVMLNRYIDFEMTHLFDPPQQAPKPTAEASKTMTGEQLGRLRERLDAQFTSQELWELGFELGVDMENLPGINKSVKSKELILHLQRTRRLPELIESIQRHRPDTPLDDIIKRP